MVKDIEGVTIDFSKVVYVDTKERRSSINKDGYSFEVFFIGGFSLNIISDSETTREDFVKVWKESINQQNDYDCRFYLPELDRYDITGGMGYNIGLIETEKCKDGDWVLFSDIEKIVKKTEK